MASSDGSAATRRLQSARTLSDDEDDGSQLQVQLMSPAQLANPLCGTMVKQFSQSIVILSRLCKFPGDRIPAEDHLLRIDKNTRAIHACRNFLYHLCIVCDYQRGGNTVTSMVLEDTGDGTCFWVASNKGSLGGPRTEESIHTKIINFLYCTLSMMQKGYSRDNWTAAKRNLEQLMFRHFTTFAHQRLLASWLLLQKAITAEIYRVKQLTHINTTIQDRYVTWLRSFTSETKPSNLEDFCRRAYNERTSEFIKPNVLRERDIIPKPASDNPASDVRHYLGRMGSTLRAAKFLARIAATHPELCANFKIKDCSAEPHEVQFGKCKKLVPNELAVEMLPAGSRDQARVADALQRLETTSGLLENVKTHINSRDFRPRIHAECAVAEAVYAARIRFFGNDRYISCSKPACFCCYHYLCNHPGRFVHPPCHNRVWPNWRAPSLLGNHDLASQQQAQKRLLNRVLEAINQAAIRTILGKSGSVNSHPDSTSGITTTVGEYYDEEYTAISSTLLRRASISS